MRNGVTETGAVGGDQRGRMHMVWAEGLVAGRMGGEVLAAPLVELNLKFSLIFLDHM